MLNQHSFFFQFQFQFCFFIFFGKKKTQKMYFLLLDDKSLGRRNLKNEIIKNFSFLKYFYLKKIEIEQLKKIKLFLLNFIKKYNN